jgi:hypothetical protein
MILIQTSAFSLSRETKVPSSQDLPPDVGWSRHPRIFMKVDWQQLPWHPSWQRMGFGKIMWFRTKSLIRTGLITYNLFSRVRI